MDQQRYTPEEEEEIRRLYGVLSDLNYWEPKDGLMQRAHQEMSRVLFSKFMKGRPEFHDHYVEIINNVDEKKPVYFTGKDYPRFYYGPTINSPEDYVNVHTHIPLESAQKLFAAHANIKASN